MLLDNFYVNADVSADGHNWSTAAIAPDYVQKLWPNEYASRAQDCTISRSRTRPRCRPPDTCGPTPPWPASRIRNFGYMVNNKPKRALGGEQIERVRDPVLAKVTNRIYRGFDLALSGRRARQGLSRRAGRVREDRQHAAADRDAPGQRPHQRRDAPGKIAPLSSAADNDYAVGMIVEGVSKSKFWTSTAIFVLEDDAQNGPDHVDSHRSPAFVISSYMKRHMVDSTMYNTTSMLRTIEFLLGLQPMTHFDAGARPMTAVFQTTPDPRRYTVEKPAHSARPAQSRRARRERLPPTR